MRAQVCRRISALLLSLVPVVGSAAELPKIAKENGRFVFRVDGKPYLVLGVQINNSSAWPATMPQVWPLLDSLPINTVEAPVYWEQIEPRPGEFDFSSVDMLVTQAREHKVRLDLLWFGTWKNGQMHYAPEWVKSDAKKYPRVMNEAGEPVDVLTANSETNLKADIAAYVALMKHLKQIDGEQHTVILMQVENEPGSVGAVRDHGPEAEAAFTKAVPAEVVRAVGKQPGSWRQVFGLDADEAFQAYSIARYIDQVAAAGRQVMDLPSYVNVWQRYPFGTRRPGFDYPSGGATSNVLDIWKAVAHSIDLYAPDTYSDDPGMQEKIVENYDRPDNPLWICETGHTPEYALLFYRVLGRGGFGASSFGIDLTNWNLQSGKQVDWMRDSFAPLLPMAGELAAWNAAGKLKTSVEEPGKTKQVLAFGRWQIVVSYGGYKAGERSEQPAGTEKHDGRLIAAQVGPDEFVVTGIDASIAMQLDKAQGGGHGQILRVEEGSYKNGTWVPLRIWNGDQTDHGMRFRYNPLVLKIKMGSY